MNRKGHNHTLQTNRRDGTVSVVDKASMTCLKVGLHVRDFRCFYTYEIFLPHIPTHTKSNDPYVSSLSEKIVPHRYQCEISVTNAR